MSECVHGLEWSTCATCSPKPEDLIGGRRRGAAGGDSLTGFFELLGAPLINSRWSWGSERKHDGVVFLRVWDDQIQVIDGARVVLGYKHIEGYRSPGIPERLHQLELVRRGAKCFLVFCSADDPDHEPRSIAAYKARYLTRAGRIVESGGDTWIELGDDVLADEVMRGTA